MVARRCILWTLLPWLDKVIGAPVCVASDFLSGIEREVLSCRFVRRLVTFPLPALPPEEVRQLRCRASAQAARVSGAGRDVGIGAQDVWTWFHNDVILNGGRGRQVTRGWRPRPATARAPGSIHAALWRLATTSSCRSCPRGVPSEPATWRKPNARSSPRRRGHENAARHTPGHRRCPRRS